MNDKNYKENILYRLKEMDSQLDTLTTQGGILIFFAVVCFCVFGILLSIIISNTNQPIHVTNSSSALYGNQKVAFEFCGKINQTYISYDTSLCSALMMQVTCLTSTQQLLNYCVNEAN